LSKFVGNLELPCYENITKFYYYDVLEAFARHLFQQIIDYEKQEIIREEGLDELTDEEDEKLSKKSNNSQVSESHDIGIEVNGKNEIQEEP